MEKSTISMAIFNSYVTNYQRVLILSDSPYDGWAVATAPNRPQHGWLELQEMWCQSAPKKWEFMSETAAAPSHRWGVAILALCNNP